MDFDKLMKQAKTKQKVAEQKHVLQKQHKEESRKREIDTQKEEKRKAAERLREMKESERRKLLEYKGLISSNKNSHSSASPFSVPSTPLVSGSATTAANKDRVKEKGRDKGGGGGGGGGSRPAAMAAGTSSSSSSSSTSKKLNKNASKPSSSSGKPPITKHTGKSSLASPSAGRSKSTTTTPSSSKTKSSKISPPSSALAAAAVSAKSNSKRSISHSSSTSSKAKSKPVAQTSNFADLLKTAKQNASGDKGTSRLDKSACAGKSLDGAKLKEPTRRSLSPVGRSLLERNHSRLKNKRSYDMMKRGINPKDSSPPPPPSRAAGGSGGNYPSGGTSLAAKSGQMKSRLGPAVSQAKSNDLVRRPLRSPGTNGPPTSLPPSKQNGMRSSSQLEQADKMSRLSGSRAHTAPTSSTSTKAQSTASSTKGGNNNNGGVRGSRTPFPPLSSLTPQQIQKLKTARAAAALAGGGMPPAKKKKTVNPTAFYGSAAASLLQRRGQPKLTASGGPLKYTSSYVDEMMDFLRSEGVNGVEDLYSDEEEGEMDDFIASDDEFIDDSEEGGDYSSVIGKIFRYDRSRYADYDDEEDSDIAMESSYAQQEYEESRSARIGRQEDEEDIRREQQQLSKKKGKSSGKLSVDKSRLKQSKLTFR